VIALFTKETDGIRPIWFGVFAFSLWFALTHALDPHGRSPRSEVLVDSLDDWTFSCALLAFFLGHSMVAREYRDGHIEFLDGLPLGRGRVFVAKVAAAMLPLLALIATTGLTKWVVCWLAGTPHALGSGHALAVHLALFSALNFGFLGLGFALSWIGGLGWGILIFGMMLGLVLSIEWAAIRPFMPLQGIMQTAWDGSRATQVWGPAVFWILVGATGFTVSGALFLGPGQVFVRTGSWLLGGVRVLAVGCFSTLLLLLSFLSLIGLLGNFSERLWVDTRTTQTEHFRWLYRAESEPEALGLIGVAERINSELATLIGNDQLFSLDIELLSAARYHAGSYLGGKIRLDGDAGADTLAHELAHAHAYAICGWAAHHQSDHVRFFQEGLADYYQRQVIPDTEGDTSRIAAVIWKTEQARFDLMVEDERRSAQHDLAQVYPLGQQFVEALVHVEGPDAPACILRSLRDVGAEDIAGISLWHHMMEACDADLDAVIRAYEARLERIAATLPELPDLSAQVLRSGHRATALRITDRAHTDVPLLCRFRDDVDTPINDFEHRVVNADGTCPIPNLNLGGKTFWYQLGFRPFADEDYVFLEWTAAPL